MRKTRSGGFAATLKGAGDALEVEAEWLDRVRYVLDPSSVPEAQQAFRRAAPIREALRLKDGPAR